MTAVIRAAADLQTVCEAHRWRYCFIGGAVLRWGEPRETVDVDLMLLTGFTDEASYIEILLQRFEPRRADAAAFARAARSSAFRFPLDVELRTCSAEDLIVFKAFADRPKDWLDVEGVIVRQGARLDWQYVMTELAPLAELKEAPDIVPRLERLRDRLSA